MGLPRFVHCPMGQTVLFVIWFRTNLWFEASWFEMEPFFRGLMVKNGTISNQMAQSVWNHMVQLFSAGHGDCVVHMSNRSQRVMATVCACVYACMRACVRSCVRACVHRSCTLLVHLACACARLCKCSYVLVAVEQRSRAVEHQSIMQ